MNRNNKLHTDKRREGFVLVLTLFAVLILSALIIAFINIAAIDLSLVKNHMCSSKAYYIAEAGVADAIDKIQRDALVVNEWENYFPAGASNKYNVVVTSGPTFVVTSTGVVSAANFTRVLEARVKVMTDVAPYKVSVKHFKEVIQ
jgi:hypothetical protein